MTGTSAPKGPGAVPIDAPCLNAYVVDVVIVDPSTDPPVLTSIDPTTAEVGSARLTLTVTGSGFTPNAAVLFNDGAEPTTFVSPTELTIGVDPSTASGAWTVPVAVRQGARRSEPVDFAFTEPAPPPVPPTGVTAGAPGAFSPVGAEVPANIAALRALGLTPGAAWATGEYVVIGSGNVHWTGTDWATGIAPEPEPEDEPE